MAFNHGAISLLLVVTCMIMMMIGHVYSLENVITAREVLAQKQGDVKSIKASINQIELMIRADEYYSKAKLGGYIDSKKSTLEELTSTLKIVQYEVDILSSLCSDKKGPNCDGKVIEETTTTTTPIVTTNMVVQEVPKPTIKKLATAFDSEKIITEASLPDGKAAKTCKEYLKLGKSENGIYYIKPFEDEAAFKVYCDMGNGGYIQFQRRIDGKVDFLKKWKDYADGFGDSSTDYWLGLKRISKFTQKFKTSLRIDMYYGRKKQNYYAKYSEFSVGSEDDQFRLKVGGYSGDAGDSFLEHNNFQFSTIDRDNDIWEKNCAEVFKGAFWYSNCHSANLNGAYLKGDHSTYADGMEWRELSGYHYSLEKSSMAMIEQ